MQLKIIDMIWGKKKYVREFEVMVMMLVVFFSPLQISSIPAQNTGIIKDLFNYICIYAFLLPNGQELTVISQAILFGTTLYIDPTSWPLVLGFLLCDTKK